MPFMRTLLFIAFITVGHSFSVFGQTDSVLLFSRKVSLGISKKQVDSLFPFFIDKHYKTDEFERTLTGETTQYFMAYFGMKTGMSYVMKFLFDTTGLIYYKYYDPYEPQNSFVLKNNKQVDQILITYNSQHRTKENFSTLLYSYTSRVYDLDKPFENFIYKASYKDKQKLLDYTKSLCPEYRAAAIIKIVELETKRKFLNTSEKSSLKQIAYSDVNIHFRNGCIVSFEPLYMFIDMQEKLKVLNN